MDSMAIGQLSLLVMAGAIYVVLAPPKNPRIGPLVTVIMMVIAVILFIGGQSPE